MKLTKNASVVQTFITSEIVFMELRKDAQYNNFNAKTRKP
jgi:hypothetical protein